MDSKQPISSTSTTRSNLISFHVNDENVLTLLDYTLQMNTPRFIVERGDKEWRVTMEENGNEARAAALKKLFDNTPQIILAS